MEETKRLAPTPSTLRELYLKSGNICAMPDCHKLIVDENGFCGEVAHIAAAEENGERFDKNMTNEERRSFENLMLLCPTCHTLIDKKGNKYTTADLKRIKKEHEAKCGNFLEKIRNSIPDLQDAIDECKCTNCIRLHKVLKMDYSDNENIGNAEILNNLLAALKNLPPETRELLAIMVKHSFWVKNELLINLFKIKKFIERSDEFILSHVALMSQENITSAPFLYSLNPEEIEIQHIKLYGDRKIGWNYWKEIKEFCEKESIPFSRIIFDLDFSVFDEV